MSGVLYVVATPIGDLKDITLRALEVLKSVDLIACEDTRHTKKLLDAYEITTSCISYHEHNEKVRSAELSGRLARGESIALVSDAGTPTISDPGYRLVRSAAQAAIDVVPIPGACAAVAALSVSGLPSDRFLFVGFLPKKGRTGFLEELSAQRATLLFYVPARDLSPVLKQMHRVFGPREVMVGRELTKRFEEIRRGSLLILKEEEFSQRGEATVVVAGAEKESPASQAEVERLVVEVLEEGVSRKEAARRVAKRCHWPTRDVYALAVELKD